MKTRPCDQDPATRKFPCSLPPIPGCKNIPPSLIHSISCAVFLELAETCTISLYGQNHVYTFPTSCTRQHTTPENAANRNKIHLGPINLDLFCSPSNIHSVNDSNTRTQHTPSQTDIPSSRHASPRRAPRVYRRTSNAPAEAPERCKPKRARDNPA